MASTTSATGSPTSNLEPGALIFEATAKGDEPDARVPFDVRGRFSFNSQTRQLGYDIRPTGTSPEEIAGIYLHRRANRPNGGVAYILAKSSRSPIAGRITMTEAEASDLKAGKFSRHLQLRPHRPAVSTRVQAPLVVQEQRYGARGKMANDSMTTNRLS